MPVRKLPRSSRSITGRFPSQKRGGVAQFESTLERDFFLLLEFDPAVRSFEEQPLSIEYQDAGGRLHHYIPDVRIDYHPACSPSFPPHLIEIKYEADLVAQHDALRPKLQAAMRYAAARGWVFRVLTERDIRTPRLANARFLLPYQQLPPDDLAEARLIAALERQGPMTPSVLLYPFGSDAEERAHLLCTLWRLLATGRIHTDLERPLGPQSRLVLAPSLR
jgi:hypothetical protein